MACAAASLILLVDRALAHLERSFEDAREGEHVEQIAPLRQPVVVEHRLDALLPLPTLIAQRVTQPHPRAQVQDVIGWDPRLRQPREHQQLAQMPGVRAIALGALLVAAPSTGLRGLGQCARPPTARTSSTTNRQPVVASNATSRSAPRKRHKNRATGSRCAGATRVRLTSPVSVSIHSAVICPRCWSSPITIVTRGLLKLHG
jgi:hypothetical protein